MASATVRAVIRSCSAWIRPKPRILVAPRSARMAPRTAPVIPGLNLMMISPDFMGGSAWTVRGTTERESVRPSSGIANFLLTRAFLYVTIWSHNRRAGPGQGAGPRAVFQGEIHERSREGRAVDEHRSDRGDQGRAREGLRGADHASLLHGRGAGKARTQAEARAEARRPVVPRPRERQRPPLGFRPVDQTADLARDLRADDDLESGRNAL